MTLRLLVSLGLALLLSACSSSSSDDGGVDAHVHDFAKIEGPITRPIVDLPVHPDLVPWPADLPPPDLPVPDGPSAE